MNQLSLFSAALGLSAPWEVVDARFEPAQGRIDFDVAFARGSRFDCPHCGAVEQAVHDTLERSWRHLNFFQYQAYINARVPRVRCADCGKTTQIEVPWARPGSGFPLLMEALLITMCRAMPIRQVALLLGAVRPLPFTCKRDPPWVSCACPLPASRFPRPILRQALPNRAHRQLGGACQCHQVPDRNDNNLVNTIR